jgi:hypothetical protein
MPGFKGLAPSAAMMYVRRDSERTQLRDGGAEPHVDARGADTPGLPFQVLAEPGLERHVLFAVQYAAELPVFFAQDDLVPVSGGRQGRLQSGRTAARYENLLLSSEPDHVQDFNLVPGLGIDRTGAPPRPGAVGQAGVAAQALVDILVHAHARLHRQVRVGQEPPADLDDVGLTRGDDLLHERGVRERADRRDRRFHVSFDLARVLNVAAVFIEHTRKRDRTGVWRLVMTGGNVDEVRAAVERFGDPHALVDIVAGLRAFRAADADFDRKARADISAHAVKDRERQPHPVVKAAAPTCLSCC